ncbi:sulfatase [Labilibacter sediminis]|nr:sulfatase [Labilibacter sediminis]
MKVFLKFIFSIGFVFSLIACSQEKPNVLLLYMDDLRPELGCYGAKHIHSPNIDALADKGIQFNNAYCNVAVCGASRASMLTGLRPTRNRFRDYQTFVQVDTPNAITLPQVFKNNGYTTISNGKIYHHLDDRMGDWDEVWRPYAFDKNPLDLKPTDWWQSLWRDYQQVKNKSIYKNTGTGPAFEMADVPDSAYIDGLLTQKVLSDLEKLKNSGETFLLTAGFISPHLPFNAPERHWQKYIRQDIKLPENNHRPIDEPDAAIFHSYELRQYTDIPPIKTRVPDETALSLIHGYYATVSYVDALVGKILDKLKELELDKNTIVVFLSDHGYNLQEHGQWGKWTKHQTSIRVPLIISSPFIEKSHSSDALVELVDVFPTLIELCQLSVPEINLEGESMVPHLHKAGLKGKPYVLVNNRNGFTLKNIRYNYTEFLSAKDTSILARTLYDHKTDVNENYNVAEKSEYQATINELHNILHAKYSENMKVAK